MAERVEADERKRRMTREEAIKFMKAIKRGLKSTGKDYPYRDEYIPKMKEACGMAIKALEAGWIPVSERLPEKYTYTLWCASSGYVRSDYFNGEFWEDAKKYCYKVIAWMPLPEQYKIEPQESEE